MKVNLLNVTYGRLKVVVCALTAITFLLNASSANAYNTNQVPVSTNRWKLDDCLTTALEKSHRRQASRFAVAAAEAQHRQVLSAYWPQVNGRMVAQRMDEAPNFIFPASNMVIPPQNITVPGGLAMVTIPAGVLGPTEVQLPVNFPGQSISTPMQQFPIPAQNIKLMDPESVIGSINATWLLYDGGMRRGLKEQAQGGMEAARQEARRTDLEVTDSVTRMYYGAILARQLHQLGRDTLDRMQATLGLTETMYKEGSGKVTKSDFLDNKVTVETIRSLVALLEKNELMSQAALANTMGLTWQDNITPETEEIPFAPFPGDLDQLVTTAYQFSPDWAQLQAGLRAAAGNVKAARSGHMPKIALTGELHRWWNDYDSGMATQVNKEGWTVGIGLEIPISDGFLARNRVHEAKAREDKLEQESYLLKDGIGLMIKDAVLSLNAARKSFDATAEAMKSAVENRDLNTRAYQNELVETEKVIRAQLMEALMTAQHYKTRYDHVAFKSQLNLIVGTEVARQLKISP